MSEKLKYKHALPLFKSFRLLCDACVCYSLHHKWESNSKGFDFDKSFLMDNKDARTFVKFATKQTWKGSSFRDFDNQQIELCVEESEILFKTSPDKYLGLPIGAR